MARTRRFLEGQSFTARFVFLDEDNAPASPLTARYRIDCKTSGQVIVDWTVIDPVSQTVEIRVTPSQNRIINSRNDVERRQMVVQSNYDTDEQAVQESEWDVKNLQGVT